MFLSNFKLTAHPFTENAPIEWLLRDERFEQALARLKFFIDYGSIALIIGQTGIGKSSMLRLFKHNLPKNRYQSVYIHLTPLTPHFFLRLIVNELGESPKYGKDQLFLQIINRINKNDMDTLLIIDEAHLLSPQALTDIRLLVSAENTSKSQLRIILSAQDPISFTLKRSSLADLLDRISVRYNLKPLSKAQTVLYMEHRLRCAGGLDKIFTSEAKNLIHDYSGGVPRQINNIATACLINAASKNFNIIDEKLMNETMSEFYLP